MPSSVCESITPIHAILNAPASTAIRHVSLNSSSAVPYADNQRVDLAQHRVDAIQALDPDFVPLLSVMSSPMLAIPITSPSLERSRELFQRISRRSPERVRMSFS